MFDWIVSVTEQYMEPLNCVQTNDLNQNKLFEIDLFDHLNVCK